MANVGIVDLGSNTARLVVYIFDSGRWFRLVDDIREPVRLGQGLWTEGRLQPAAMDRTLAALKLFSDYASARGLETVDVIGTSAVRDADNRAEFLDRVRELDLEVVILTGQEEARLGVLAVANGFDLDDAWVMDLGGGSAQISRMRGRRLDGGDAYPLGAVRLTEAFQRHDPPLPKEVQAMEQEIEARLRPVATVMQQDDAPLVAMGGTIRNLAQLVQNEQDYPLDILHGFYLEKSDLEGVTSLLQSLPSAKRAKQPGINPDRADVILAGALVYRWLLRHAGRDGLYISGHGVREGAFFRHFLPEPHLLENVRSFSIRNLFQRAAQPEAHTDQVRGLARRLFDCLQPLHGLDQRAAELLDAAATLHDIGTAIHYYSHHRHGSYLISAAPLHGYSHREQAILRQLVRYHHSGTPKRQPFRELVRSKDKPGLLALATCLRLAEYLERSRASRVRDVSVEIGPQEVVLLLHAAEEPTVELWETRKHAPLFEKAFHRTLVLEWAREDGPDSDPERGEDRASAE